MALSDADEQSILNLFIELLPPERWKELEGDKRPQIFSLQVVAAMMLLQRLDAQGTQAEVVRQLAAGRLDHLLPDSKRAREKMISDNTGRYATACRQFAPELMEQVCAEMLTELGKRIQPAKAGERAVLLVDGSSVSLAHDPELLPHYPPSRNQCGEAHWGMVRVLVLHDVRTGIALHPQWGPMYGSETVSEQELAERALEKAPPGCVILADANFGIFSFAYRVVQGQRQVLLRLTGQRAQALGASQLLPYGEEKFCWRPTRKDREKNPGLPQEAKIAGRLMAVRQKGFRHPLYLFTTLSEEMVEVITLYRLRWNVELDLRSLKRTLGLFHLRGKSKEAIEKELLVAMVAYGLVRVIMAAAARRRGLEPRRLSFTAACSLLNLMIGKLCCGDRAQREQEFERLLRLMAQAKLPNRSQPRSFERAVWGFRQSFPPRRSQSTAEKIK